jgi:hypothetical protein
MMRTRVMASLAAMMLMTCWLPACAFKDQLAPDASQPEAVGAEALETATEAMGTEVQGAAVKAPGDWNPTAARTPDAVHLTWQRDPSTTVTLQWQTGDKDQGAYVPKAWLARAQDVPGADPEALGEDAAADLPFNPALTATGTATRYCQELLCVPSKINGLQWEVEFTSLEPDTVYFYRVGTWEDFDRAAGTFSGAELSPVYHFRTGQAKGDRAPFVFGFGSDSQNWMDDITAQVTHIGQNTGREARFWLHGGDLTEVGTQQELWDWFDVLAPLLHHWVLLPVKGNHDIVREALFGEFALPRMDALPDGLKEYAWSLDFGNVHLVGFDSITESQVEKQRDFLEADLASASADPDIDWIIAAFHYPMYSSASVHGGTDYLISLVAPLFDAYGVDLTFSGHDHDYERTLPIKAGQIMDSGKGTVYITSGGFYSKKSYGNGSSDWTAFSADGELKSYVIVTVDGNTLSGVAYQGNHQVLDTFTLTK